MIELKSSPVAENEYVRALIEALQADKTPGANEFTEMIDHITVIEQRLAVAVGELEAMREDLRKMQDHSLKTSLQKTYRALETGISDLRQKLSELKAQIAESCKVVLADFKAHGTAALDGVVRFLRLKPALEAIRADAQKCKQHSDRAMGRIEAFSREYHTAGKHLKNMGRALFGQEAITEIKPGGKVTDYIKAPYRAERAVMGKIASAAEKSVETLSRLEQAAQRKPSVLKTIRENTDKVQPPVEKPAPTADRSER